jgi:hypothetical protein
MAQVALGSFELRADLLAQLAQNGGSAQQLAAPSHTVGNTSSMPVVLFPPINLCHLHGEPRSGTLALFAL